VETMSILASSFFNVKNRHITMGLKFTSRSAKSATKMAMMMPAIAPPCNAFDFASAAALSLLLDGMLEGYTEARRDGRYVGCSEGISVGAA
jgi:hypothetical protein